MKYSFTYEDIDNETHYGVLTYIPNTRVLVPSPMFGTANVRYTLATVKKSEDGTYMVECYRYGIDMDGLSSHASMVFDDADILKFKAATSHDALAYISEFNNERVTPKGCPLAIMDTYDSVVDLIKKGMKLDYAVFKL